MMDPNGGGYDSSGGGGAGPNGSAGNNTTDALCASCDRCRARKTRCDSQRPCGNCAAKYMKRHKLASLEGIPLEAIECVYSLAKRRGPVPGKAAGATRKAADMEDGYSGSGSGNHGMANVLSWTQQQQQQQAAAFLMQSGGYGGTPGNGLLDPGGANGSYLAALGNGGAVPMGALDLEVARRIKPRDMSSNLIGGSGSAGAVPRTIASHTHLLEPTDPDGSRLHSYYRLSIDEIFRLPPAPRVQDMLLLAGGGTSNGIGGSDNSYLAMTMEQLPFASHPALAAWAAAQFAELALGALVHNEVAWAMELCNAVVHCLRDSVGRSDAAREAAAAASPVVQYEVTRAYFLLGVFRACRGDMVRYFKYRSVCMAYISKMEPDDKTTILMSAISFLDSWAYMLYNGDENDLPEGCISSGGCGLVPNDATMNKYGIDTNIQAIARDPRNRNWIQGAPPVYLNNEAPLHARSLDAVACAIRHCCDQANTRFAMIAAQAGGSSSSQQQGHSIPMEPGEQDMQPLSLTSVAVMSHENELCSRNIILSAYTLMQQHDALNKGRHKYDGLHMVISVMDAFLENSDDESQGGFTDSQIQSLLSVCNTTLENPLLLHHAGPTYHMITNAAVLLCHLLNGMSVAQRDDSGDDLTDGTEGSGTSMEQSLFEEVLDTFLPIRKLLTIHRRKLPVKMRCHGIPRPSFRFRRGAPLVDLGETLLCPCRGCQGFVLMACSPCVAAERARAALHRVEMEEAQELEAVQLGEVDKAIDDIGAEFDLDDDALLGMIGNLITS